ncbi:MAG: YmdB family metallophosphoesterase, partial [bacterium]
MNILMIGDISGKPGRMLIRELLPGLKREFKVDFVIANGENAASGSGITRETANELFLNGVDILTMGNHTWDKKEIFHFIDQDERIVRPLNYPPGTPGQGSAIIDLFGHRIGIINLLGRAFLPPIDCPFRAIDHELEKMKKETNIILVDFHAETTSEKIALGWYLDGRVSAVAGTHTHVQTADETVLP